MSMMFYKDKRVLVTGGTGFVGSHIVDALLDAGARVRVPLHHRPLVKEHERIETVTADLANLADCLRVLSGIDYVFHAAGAVAGAAVSAGNPMSAISVNLILTVNLLEAAWSTGVERILLFSSSTGYPPLTYPVQEEDMWRGEPHPAYFGYGWMRRFLEKLGTFTAMKTKTKIAIVRPTAVYGRHDNFHPLYSHVIPALIRKAVEGMNPFEVWGSGDEVRDFLHITDLARGCLAMLDAYAVCEPLNIGYGEGVTVKEIVRIILNAADRGDTRVIFNADKPTTIPFRMVDITKARAILGFKPEISLADGLQDTVEWYKEMGKKQEKKSF